MTVRTVSAQRTSHQAEQECTCKTTLARRRHTNKLEGKHKKQQTD